MMCMPLPAPLLGPPAPPKAVIIGAEDCDCCERGNYEDAGGILHSCKTCFHFQEEHDTRWPGVG